MKLKIIKRLISIHEKQLGNGGGFIDYKQSLIRPGHGGDGAIAFVHAINKELGPPCGGNGGRGGDLIIKCSKNITSLNEIKESYRIDSGKDGGGKGMNGQNGKDTIIHVPLGTVVRQLEHKQEVEWSPTELQEELYKNADPRVAKLLYDFKFKKGYVPQEDRIRMLMERIPPKRKPQSLLQVDFVKDQQTHVFFKGGRGGFGNPHFRSALITGPGIAGRGEKVKEMLLEFELKTIADAGLVGLPNAGKSTLLKAVSNAHPKIAPYPFTTLNPYVGTIDFSDYWTMSISDMPGIIKDAHKNVGLGHRFLRHIERNKIFVYVIDLSSSNPIEDLNCLQFELEAYKKGMTIRPSIVAANKADVSEISKSNYEKLKEATALPIVPISAKYEKNITKLTSLMRSMVDKIKQ